MKIQFLPRTSRFRHSGDECCVMNVCAGHVDFTLLSNMNTVSGGIRAVLRQHSVYNGENRLKIGREMAEIFYLKKKNIYIYIYIMRPGRAVK